MCLTNYKHLPQVTPLYSQCRTGSVHVKSRDSSSASSNINGKYHYNITGDSGVNTKRQSFPATGLSRPLWIRKVKASGFFRISAMKVVRSSPLRTGRLYPQEFSWCCFLEAESTLGHMVPSVASEKKSPATPLGIDPETLRLAAQCLNHYATPGPGVNTITMKTVSRSG
jgi:hypothetical protein